ncbi:MAG: hypothetical protein AAFN40_03375 [Cyanobacteria bacterium J06560_6]
MTNLQKAKLTGQDEAQDIEFMFNPSELSLSRSMSIEQAEGARTKTGQNKTSFKHPNPYSMKVGNLIFDTYESGKSVLEHVSKLSKAVEFTDRGKGKNKRPPIYLFTWGDHKYLRVFVKNFSCRLTLFLPNGTPVRAIIDLDLEQVEPPEPPSDLGAKNPSPSDRKGPKTLFN